MKETQENHKDKIEIVQEQVSKPIVNIKKMILKKGHTIFEFNRKTGEIQPASYEPIPASFTHEAKKEKFKPYGIDGVAANPKIAGKIIIKENCSYIPALNIQNAVRKMGLKVKLVKTKKKKL